MDASKDFKTHRATIEHERTQLKSGNNNHGKNMIRIENDRIGNEYQGYYNFRKQNLI